MKLSEMFPSRFVKGDELNGKSVTVTIARVAAETVRPSPGSPEETKFALYFTESKSGRGVILSKVLATQIARALGSDDTDDWPGRRITLYPESVTVAGVPRVAIRARAASPAPQPAGANGSGSN